MIGRSLGRKTSQLGWMNCISLVPASLQQLSACHADNAYLAFDDICPGFQHLFDDSHGAMLLFMWYLHQKGVVYA